MSVPVLVNAGGGTARGLGDRCAGEVEKAFAAAGLSVEVRMLPGEAIGAAAAALADRALVVVGGGDGTLGSAAGELARGGAALGILPLGTRNHLARELGVPLDLGAAAKLIAARPIRRIDLARANGRAFVNNASIGAYPELVEERDRRDAPKWLATLPATWAVLKRLRHHRLRLTLAGREQPVLTPLLFVGNNRYALDAGRLGAREALDDGVLCVFAVAAKRRRDLVGFALRTVMGRADPQRDFALIGDTAELTVDGHPASVAVALDGEVTRLPLPLRFTVEPGALGVVAPLEGDGATA
ncbi:diacylglycerol/lipid kinase family protein [uncultured Sphingomonas sp.]|uniref:diacylglycerol/lipid kinase family protein n=1 Tax=uncultured Sphingomonas sp. TaxID=158754 RepID=UPI0035CAE840